jgi:hypothetical protein
MLFLAKPAPDGHSHWYFGNDHAAAFRLNIVLSL